MAELEVYENGEWVAKHHEPRIGHLVDIARANGYSNWRVVRIDKVIAAQSIAQPSTPDSTDTPATSIPDGASAGDGEPVHPFPTVRLNTAQESTLEYLHAQGESQVFSRFQTKAENEYKAISREFVTTVNAGGFASANYKYVLTEAGRKLTAYLFGNAEYLIFNRIIDTDPMEYEDEIEVLNELREFEINGDTPQNYLVQKSVRENLVYSVTGTTWLEHYAPVIVNPAPANPSLADAAIPFADTDDELWAAGGSPFTPAIDDDSDSNDSDNMLSIPAYTPDSVVSEAAQVSSSVKAKNAPTVTKKERRKQKQNAIRQQYQVAQIEYRRQQEHKVITLLQQAWAVGKAA